MAEESCSTEDILCQIQVLAHLRGIKAVLGNEKSREAFPDFEGWEGSISERIDAHQGELEANMRRCGMLAPEEAVETLVEPSGIIVDEESAEIDD